MATAQAKPTARRHISAVQVGATRIEYAPPAGKSKRVSVGDDDGSSGQASTYFTNVDERTDLHFVSAGCAVLNAALGGGWVLGRVANIVGDKSAGKTLLAIEACANFHHQYPKGRIRYAEAESAFDERYAEALGMPVDAVDFGAKEKPVTTVEEFHDDVIAFIESCKDSCGLYILDSLDALSDDAESEREITDSSYGASKAKKMGELFRRVVNKLEMSNVLLVVISQLRDKLNVTFGEKQTRSGGRALDFYASHIVWLAEKGKIVRTREKIERVTGVSVRARVKKNKVGLPFRECEYPILFGYGVDDFTANVEWLIESGCETRLAELDLSKAGYKVSLMSIRDKGGERARALRAKLDAVVWQEWQRIESGFLPKSRKY